MNYKQIEAFRAVMLTRSMTEAAAQLHTSQPNISRVIGKLEQEAGFRLFERVGNRLAPTDEAEALFLDVERSFVGLDSLRASARSIRESGVGTLRIGTVPSIAMSVMPQAILAFRERYPDVPIAVHTNDSPTVAKWTAARFCDIGLVSYMAETTGIRSELLRREDGVCIVPATHRLARKRRLHASDLDGERFISLTHGDGTRTTVDAAFVPADRRVLTLETPYAATICTMVGMGLGVSVVNPLVVRSLKPAGVKAIPFEPVIAFESHILFNPQRPVPALAQWFLACLRRASGRRSRL
ncbi:DNA-binding transcriptional LysR family regulator [Cupriavidus alkaliphilus]|uniref:LysR substrate-binding domain-containing protein n=1 Tax=Cupriavidus alkaliphilus TaxID=942866 RepID=UPI000DE70D54|nr:LysR substrate-binding domain-containing protein [Cupriavidus alkaliphilus]PVY77957.1 DNA-binding transcriptional LysR family regulator [Cupriavidus alkaliphilus]